jgi:hypothetical protein
MLGRRGDAWTPTGQCVAPDTGVVISPSLQARTSPDALEEAAATKLIVTSAPGEGTTVAVFLPTPDGVTFAAA